MSEPVRIVHVIESVESGGAEQQLLALVQNQDHAKWKPFVVCTHAAGSLRQDFETAGVPVELVGKRGSLDVGLAFRLAAVLERLRPDILHTWMFAGNLWGRAAALLLPRRPIIVAAERNVDTWKTIVHTTCDRVLTRMTDAFIGNADQVGGFLAEVERIPAERIHIIRNGLAFERVQACLGWNRAQRLAYRRKLGLTGDAFVVGNISRPSFEKRFDLLAEILRRLVALRIPVQLLQIGRDPSSDYERRYFADFQRLLVEYGVVRRVFRRGYLREFSPELAVMDALVQASDIEGFPNSVLESLAMEVPVVATAAGGTADMVIHRQTGWLVPVGDTAGLVDGLEYVYRHPDEAHRWGAAGRARVETHFTVGTLVRNTTALYATLIKARAA